MFARRVKVLAIGAHPDDIELGSAGLLLKLKHEYAAEITSLVCSKGELKSLPEIRYKEQVEVNRLLGVKNSYHLDFKDGEIPHSNDLVSEIEKIVYKENPQIILTHSTFDHHQDHISVGLATVSAIRKFNTTLIYYPSLTTRVVSPCNLYIDIEKYMDQKMKILHVFKTQQANWYMKKRFLKSKAAEAGSMIFCKFAERFQIYFSAL